MPTARAAVHTLIDLVLTLLLAAGGTVALWYYLGDCDGFKGEPAVRAGADLLGLPALGADADLWAFGEERRFAAADNPADDERLRTWLEARPGVRNVRVRRETHPGRAEHFGYDVTVSVRYERPGHLGPLKLDWAALYCAPADDFFTRDTHPWAGPKVPPPHERWALWLLAVAALHAALLLSVLLRGTFGLCRGRGLPAVLGPPGCAVPLVLLGGVALVGLVVLNEWLVPKLIPRATPRGWVWFGTAGWTDDPRGRNWIFLRLLFVPVGAQLFVRYSLAGRWAAAGRPVVGALLTAGVVAVAWLDASLIPLGFAVGLVLVVLAVRGVPAAGLIVLHAAVNGALFVFLWTGGEPPQGHDPRLNGCWERVEKPDGLTARVRFADGGKIVTTAELPPEFRGRPGPPQPDVSFIQLDRDRLLIRQGFAIPERAGGRSWTVATVRVTFDGDELVLTEVSGSGAGTATRFRRVP